jgi:hypothetical protein
MTPYEWNNLWLVVAFTALSALMLLLVGLVMRD